MIDIEALNKKFNEHFDNLDEEQFKKDWDKIVYDRLTESEKLKLHLYTMDDNPDKWKIIYYPILSNYDCTDVYSEPRALVQNIDKSGFWHKEVPLRYLKQIK